MKSSNKKYILIDAAEDGLKQIVRSYLVKILLGYGISVSNPMVTLFVWPLNKYIIQPLFDKLELQANERRLARESAINSGELNEAETDDDFIDAFDRL